MGKRILITLGHPDPRPERLCRALAEAYHKGATEAGHDVAVIDVARLDFASLKSRREWDAPIPDTLRVPQEAIAWAEHLVIVFPLWLGTMPALLKAFFEQVFRPGFAFEEKGPRRWDRKLAGRSARIVVTMGMPSFIYKWYFRAHGVRSFERNVLGRVGIGPIPRRCSGWSRAGTRRRASAGWSAWRTSGAAADRQGTQ